MKDDRTAEQRLADNGYEDVMIFSGDSYDTALIGVDENDRAVYDYDEMCAWLMRRDGCTRLQAMEWIECNTLRSMDPNAEGFPIVMTRLRF